MQTLIYKLRDKLYGTGDFDKLREALTDVGFLNEHQIFEVLMESEGIHTMLELFNAVVNCEINIEQVNKDFEEMKDNAFRACLDYDIRSYTINIDD